MLRLWLGSLFLASAPIFVKIIELPATTIGVYRCGVGAALLWGIVLFGGARGRSPAALLVAAGLLFAADLYLWHRSVLLAGAGLGTILANTQVLYVSLFGALVHKERPGLRFWLAALLAMAGVALLARPGAGAPGEGDYLLGVALGLATGAIYAGYILTLRAAEKRGPGTSPLVNLAVVTTVSALALTAIAGAEGTLRLPRPLDWPAVLGLAALPQVVGWLLITSTIVSVPASRAGLILLGQPAAATVLGALLLGETLSARQLVGAGATLAAIYLGALPKRRSTSEPPHPIPHQRGNAAWTDTRLPEPSGPA